MTVGACVVCGFREFTNIQTRPLWLWTAQRLTHIQSSKQTEKGPSSSHLLPGGPRAYVFSETDSVYSPAVFQLKILRERNVLIGKPAISHTGKGLGLNVSLLLGSRLPVVETIGLKDNGIQQCEKCLEGFSGIPPFIQQHLYCSFLSQHQ